MPVKKLRKLVWFSVISLCTFYWGTIKAEASSKIVDANKSWNIKFSTKFKFDESTKSAIKVLDSTGKELKVEVEQGNEQKSLIVKPPAGGYEKGQTYTLSVDSNIYTLNGKQMIKNELCNKTFTISKQNTYYVSKSGNDGNDGSISKPFASIEKAFNEMKPGDIVLVRGGTYSSRIEISDKKGSEDSPYTIKAYPGENVVLDGGNNIGQALTIYNSSYITIEGISIKGYTEAAVDVKSGCSNIIMDKLNIYDLNPSTNSGAGTEGIMAEGGSSYCVVKNCNIYNIGLKLNRQLDHGIYVGYGVDHWTFENNDIHDNSGAAIQIYGNPGGKACTVINNKLYNNRQWGLVIGSESTYNNIESNMFYGNSDCDVYLLDSSKGNVLKNNYFGSNNSKYNIAISDNNSLDNTFDGNTYLKSNGTVVFRAGESLDFSKWKSYSQEEHGNFKN